MELGADERAAVERAIGPIAERVEGLASLLLETADGRVLDVAVRLDDLARPILRPLLDDHAASIEHWMQLLARRRGQLAHDLSGPATGVLAALETVLDYEPIPASSHELLEEARRGMLRVSRVLLASSAERVGGPENVVEAPLAQLLARWSEDAAGLLDGGGDQLALEVDSDEDVVRVDATALRRALGVLLSNAWRARRGGGVRARVRGQLTETHLCLGVDDDGTGMSPETLARAGELGFAVRPSGVGLGLFSLRWAIRRAGGVVVLSSSARGTQANVFLPREPTRPGP